MFNQIIMSGRLVKEPELIKVDNGTKICNLRVATVRPFRTRETGEYESDFFNISVWQALAESVSENCHKGMVVFVKGRLQNDTYTDKDGKKCYSTKIIGERIIYFETKSSVEIENKNKDNDLEETE